jgi:hypothetical protein
VEIFFEGRKKIAQSSKARDERIRVKGQRRKVEDKSGVCLMPLAFESLSHGTIAFGFFNIESDMLLCDRYFLFADAFCAHVADIADKAGDQTYRSLWPVQLILSDEGIGDLMGAIHGVRFTGFIGALYRHFPFPIRSRDFKQNPDGYRTQAQVSEIIAGYAVALEIEVAVVPGGADIQIGDYRFDRFQFQELINYVWRGGYPHWKDDIRPAYVTAMHDKIMQNRRGIFEGIVFGD